MVLSLNRKFSSLSLCSALCLLEQETHFKLQLFNLPFFYRVFIFHLMHEQITKLNIFTVLTQNQCHFPSPFLPYSCVGALLSLFYFWVLMVTQKFGVFYYICRSFHYNNRPSTPESDCHRKRWC